MSTNRPNYLIVRIISPREIIFEGEAWAVSSKNSAGSFDILPYHANFISLVENQSIYVRKIDKQVLQFKFPFAIIYHTNNYVNIYTDTETKS